MSGTRPGPKRLVKIRRPSWQANAAWGLGLALVAYVFVALVVYQLAFPNMSFGRVLQEIGYAVTWDWGEPHEMCCDCEGAESGRMQRTD